MRDVFTSFPSWWPQPGLPTYQHQPECGSRVRALRNRPPLTLGEAWGEAARFLPGRMTRVQALARNTARAKIRNKANFYGCEPTKLSTNPRVMASPSK